MVALGVAFWLLLVRPWRRERRIQLDGLLCLVFLSLYWQDIICNYLQHFATYNTVFINFGSWNADIPGWLSPNGEKIAEPFLFSGPVYVYIVLGAVIGVNWAMRRAERRKPGRSVAGLLLAAFAFFFVLDLVLEPAFMWLGFYSYPGSVRALSLFPGTRYQMPVYSAVFWASAWTGWAALRYFRNDKGETFAERGADQLKAKQGTRTWVRFLALTGAANAIFLIYNIPIQLFTVHADAWPKDVTDRSYLTSQLCGPGTDYACPGQEIPIHSRTSVHIGPDGTLRPARTQQQSPE
jgi:hypothetical protein